MVLRVLETSAWRFAGLLHWLLQCPSLRFVPLPYSNIRSPRIGRSRPRRWFGVALSQGVISDQPCWPTSSRTWARRKPVLAGPIGHQAGIPRGPMLDSGKAGKWRGSSGSTFALWTQRRPSDTQGGPRDLASCSSGDKDTPWRSGDYRYDLGTGDLDFFSGGFRSTTCTCSGTDSWTDAARAKLGASAAELLAQVNNTMQNGGD